MDIDGLIRLAAEYRQQGDLQQAEIIYKEILTFDPLNFRVLNYLGNVFQVRHRYDEAMACYQKAVYMEPAFSGSYYHLGSVFEITDQLYKAVTYYEKAIQCDPLFSGSYNNLGNVYRKLDQLDKAVSCFQKAIEVNPTFWGSYYNLGEVLQDIGQVDEAIDCFQKVLQLNPNHIASLNNLGNSLKEKGKIDEAMICYQKAIQIQPDYSLSVGNLQEPITEMAYFDDATLRYYHSANQLDPDYVEPYFNRAFIMLLKGNFEEGWREYEWRQHTKEFEKRSFPKPCWNGEGIRERAVFLYAEQGMGDTIQFVRYAPLLARNGARVIVECQAELVSLLRGVDGVQEVMKRGNALPEIDVHYPLMSLPYIFHTLLEDVPADIPYIRLDHPLKEKWGKKIKGDPHNVRVGLVWSGNPAHRNDRRRSCELETFAYLANIEGVDYFSLQKGKAAEQAKDPPAGLRLMDFMDEVNDFAETAAIIQNLDLVISVDTAVAHLAGALGKTVWTLLPYAPDWRWMLDREDSPWYPTMRLFRQKSQGEWGPVIERVAEELRLLRMTRSLTWP